MDKQTTSILYFDGGSRGNPGVAAGAAVLVIPNTEPYVISEFMKHATNNEAEYTGLIIGLKKAQQLGIKILEVKGDSQLVINQVNGLWQVKSNNLSGLYNQARRLMLQFHQIQVSWIPRMENHLADTAVNECIDRAMGKDTLSSLPKNPALLPNVLQKNSETALFEQGDLIVISPQKYRDKTRPGIIVEEPEILDNDKIRIVIEISTKE